MMVGIGLKPLVVFFFAVALLTAQSRAHAQEKKNLRIAFVSLSWNNQLPIRVAITKGFFKDQGVTLEPIFVRGGPIAITALVSGNVDYASVGGAQAPIRSNARGLDLQIISSMSNYTNYTLLGSKDARTVEELRGKIIGVTGAGAFSARSASQAISARLEQLPGEPGNCSAARAIRNCARTRSSPGKPR